MAGAIMATLYSSGTEGTLDATQTVKLTDSGGGPVSLVLAAPALLDAALTEWQTAANSSGTLAETYTFSRSGRAVTISATGAFDYELVGDLGTALGLPDSDSGSDSYTGEGASAMFTALAVDCEPIEISERVELEEYRHGRVESHVFGNHDLMRFTLYLDTATQEVLPRSYCAAGKVRVWQDTAVASAYAVETEAGYVDGYVAAMSPPQTLAFDESIQVVTLLVAVGRN